MIKNLRLNYDTNNINNPKQCYLPVYTITKT